MKISEFQQKVSRTMNPKLAYQDSLSNYAIGLAGEVGEVLEPIKKHLYHGHSVDSDHLQKELGDVAWYLAAIATTMGLDLETALQKTIEKLEKRYPNGFTVMASQNRPE